MFTSLNNAMIPNCWYLVAQHTVYHDSGGSTQGILDGGPNHIFCGFYPKISFENDPSKCFPERPLCLQFMILRQSELSKGTSIYYMGTYLKTSLPLPLWLYAKSHWLQFCTFAIFFLLTGVFKGTINRSAFTVAIFIKLSNLCPICRGAKTQNFPDSSFFTRNNFPDEARRYTSRDMSKKRVNTSRDIHKKGVILSRNI